MRTKGHEIPRASLGAPEQVRETLKLTNKDVWKNLLVMVLLPYTKRKLDEHYDIHAASANILGPAFRGDTLQDNATYKQRIFHYYKWFLRKIYPSVNAAYYFSLLAFNLAYLFDTSKYHNPFFWLIGTRIRRMNQADYKAIAAAAATPLPVSGAKPAPQSLLSPRTLTQVVYPRLLSSLKVLLPTSIFALKFLEWWHASDFARQLSRKAAEGLELPAPTITGIPKSVSSTASAQKSGVTFATSGDEKDQAKDEEKEQEEKENIKPPISAQTNLPIFTVAAPTASSNCPICLSAIQTPTAAQTGYVFCYTCIFRWLEGEHPRQVAFMQGGTEEQGLKDRSGGNREGSWDDGRGRCAVSGRRLLGGTGGLRRVMV